MPKRSIFFVVALLYLADCSRQTPGPYTKYQGMPPDGTLEMHEVQAAYIGNAGGGNGTLFYGGNAYPFTIAGLGVGGVGASTIDATATKFGITDAGYWYIAPVAGLMMARYC